MVRVFSLSRGTFIIDTNGIVRSASVNDIEVVHINNS